MVGGTCVIQIRDRWWEEHVEYGLDMGGGRNMWNMD